MTVGFYHMFATKNEWRGAATRMLIRWSLAVLIPLGLLACDGAEEREAAYFERGKSLYESGDYRKASLELRNARQINPLNVEALYYLGLIAEKQGEYRGAYNAFQSVIEQKPEHVGGNFHAGRILLMSGDVEKALERAEKAIEIDPENAEARALRGAVNLRRNKLDAARADAQFTLQKDPTNVAATSVLVGILQKENKSDEAVALLKKATAANKQETALRLLLVELYRRQKNIDGIEAVYRELFAENPKNYGYRTDLARYLVAFDKKDEAEKLLRATVDENSGRSDAQARPDRFSCQSAKLRAGRRGAQDLHRRRARQRRPEIRARAALCEALEDGFCSGRLACDRV